MRYDGRRWSLFARISNDNILQPAQLLSLIPAREVQGYWYHRSTRLAWLVLFHVEEEENAGILSAVLFYGVRVRTLYVYRTKFCYRTVN